MLSIDYTALLLSLGTIIIGGVAIKEALEKFCKAFGIKLKYVEEREEAKKCQTEVKAGLKDLAEKQGKLEELREKDVEMSKKTDKEIMNIVYSLKQDIQMLAYDMEVREAEARFKKLRYDICNFAVRISNSSEEISSDLIKNLYTEINEYEELAEKYNFKNNRVNDSIEVISNKYKQMLLEGKINDDV
jgi:hypothetical protein